MKLQMDEKKKYEKGTSYFSCKDCQIGRYSRTYGSDSSDSCILCPLGKKGSGYTGSISENEGCEECDAGKEKKKKNFLSFLHIKLFGTSHSSILFFFKSES